MSMRDDVARYSKAGLDAEYHWWDRETASEMLRGLSAALENAGPDARLICRPGLNADGVVTLWLAVEGSGITIESHDGEYNMSHPCPPFCT